MCPDHHIIKTIITPDCYSNVLKDELYECDMSLEEILNQPLIFKNTGMLYDGYTTTYPFEREKARNELEWIRYNFGKLMIYESYFLWYSDYFPLYSNTFQVLMNKEGALPIEWRYYIAIMVLDNYLGCFNNKIRLSSESFKSYFSNKRWK
jgi:hypothetical protein